MHKQNKAYLFGLAAVLMWSTVATAFKLALREMTPIQLLEISGVFSWVFLSLVLVTTKQYRLIPEYNKKQITQQLLLGLLNPLLYYWVLFAAYHLLPAQEAQALNYTWAITLMLLSVPVLGHKITPKDIFFSVLAYLGILVIATHGDVLSFQFKQPMGVILALSSTLIWSMFWLWNTKSSLSPVLGLWLNFTGALPVFLYLIFSSPEIWSISARGFYGAIYVGLFEMGIAFVCWLSAMKLTQDTSKISLMIFLSPPFSLIFIWFFLGETIQKSTLVGLGLILTALIFQRNHKPD